ncbi:hypothetical protein, partial [Bacillus thuringiensis]|uniref:hypothetical protein n=1 Tax=Bacillus thuringiensis TaxID=1428 RepID=UPI001A7E228B
TVTYTKPISSNTRETLHKIHRVLFCKFIFFPLKFRKIAFIRDICYDLAFINEKILWSGILGSGAKNIIPVQ